jgi:type IV pilus assembly protein PilA
MNGPTTQNRRGFTLIELLIVVVIIGILASIAIPKFESVRAKAHRATVMADLKNLANFQEIYYNNHYVFADNAGNAELGFTQSEGVTITINEASNTGWAATGAHAAQPTLQCGIYHGSASPANGSPATTEGVVTCTLGSGP